MVVIVETSTIIWPIIIESIEYLIGIHVLIMKVGLVVVNTTLILLISKWTIYSLTMFVVRESRVIIWLIRGSTRLMAVTVLKKHVAKGINCFVSKRKKTVQLLL